MTLSAAPFCSFSSFFDATNDRVIVSWGLVVGLDVSKVRVEVDRGSGFTEIARVDATDGRIIDFDGLAGHIYRLIGEAADAELWVPTDPFTAQSSLEPLCEVFGTVQDLQGKPIFNTPVRAEHLQIEGRTESGRSIVTNTIEVTTSALGEFRMNLLQGSCVRLVIQAANFSNPVLIPDQGSVDLKDLQIVSGDYIRVD